MDRASLVIIVSFVGAAVLLAGGLWLLVRLDRGAATAAERANRHDAAIPTPTVSYLAVASHTVVREPEPTVHPVAVDPPLPSSEPASDTSSRVLTGRVVGAAAFLAIFVLVLGARRRRHR